MTFKLLKYGKFTKISAKGDFGDNQFLDISMKKDKYSNKKYLEIYSDLTRPLLTEYNFFKGLSGGKLLFTGKIEFIRFNDDGTKTRRKFNYDPSSTENSMTNPILMTGDIINVQRNFIGTATSVIGSIARPLTSGFVIYNILSE